MNIEVKEVIRPSRLYGVIYDPRFDLFQSGRGFAPVSFLLSGKPGPDKMDGRQNNYCIKTNLMLEYH